MILVAEEMVDHWLLHHKVVQDNLVGGSRLVQMLLGLPHIYWWSFWSLSRQGVKLFDALPFFAGEEYGPAIGYSFGQNQIHWLHGCLPSQKESGSSYKSLLNLFFVFIFLKAWGCLVGRGLIFRLSLFWS